MTRYLKRVIGINARGSSAALAAVFLLVAMLSAACSPREAEGGRLLVAVTLLPQAGFVEAVGGDLVEVVVMVPPGASPHTYEATPDQMVRLSRASMYAKVGSPVEFELVWLDRLVAANSDMLVVDCSRGVYLIQADEDHEREAEQAHAADDGHSHDGADPHIWLSVRNAIVMVENICAGLAQVDPANEEYYRANCRAYVDELTSLDVDLTGLLRPLDGRPFIVFHPAFGYFARDYNLVQVAVEQGGGEPDARYIVRLIEEARGHNITVIFVAPQVNKRSAEVIAAEIKGTVVLIDPLAREYVPNMRAIAEAMLQAS